MITRKAVRSMTNYNTLEGMIENSSRILDEALNGVPRADFKHCSGIVLISAIEIGFLLSGSVGTGVVIAQDKQKKTWSPPMAIGLTGVGAGFLVGAEKKDVVVFLMDPGAMNTLSGDFQLKLGVECSAVAGPFGEEEDISLNTSNKGFTVTTSYTIAKGAFVNVGLEGTVLAPRKGLNKKFYGEDVTPKAILFDRTVTVPEGCGLGELHRKLTSLAAQVS